MTEQEFRDKYVGKAVHCDTEEKAKELLKMAHDFGWKWPMADSLWEGEDTCYRIRDTKNVTTADRDFYVEEGLKIVKFESEEKKVKKTKKVFDLGLFVDNKKQRGASLDEIINSIELWALECHGLTEEEMGKKNKVSLDKWMKEVEVKVKLTTQEIEVLKALKVLGFEWIARDEDKLIYAHSTKPKKGTKQYVPTFHYFLLEKSLFDFISWEDEEPTNVEELLCGLQ